MKLGCLIMAAGNSSRFGENKLEIQLDGKPLIERTFDAVPPTLFDEIVVVTQFAMVEDQAKTRGFTCIRNEHPDWGVSHTIYLGTTQLQECDAIMYLVSDQPLLDPVTVERVVEKWRQNPCYIVGAAHNGRRGNPCMFPKEYFDQLLALEGDHGGNVIIQANLDRLLLVEAAGEELIDVDTPEVLAQLKQSM